MSNPGLADLLGTRGKSIQWGRLFLFFGALFLGSLTLLVLSPAVISSTQTGYSLELFRGILSPESWLATLLRDVLLAGLAVVVFRLMPNAIAAVLIAALLYAPLGALIVYGETGLMMIAQGMDPMMRDALQFRLDSIWSPGSLLARALWVCFFLGGLVLALRLIKRVGPALMLGAPAGIVAHRLFMALFNGLSLPSIVLLFFSVVEMLVFAGVFWLGLRFASDRPIPPDHPEPRLSRGFYLSSWAVALGITNLVSLAVIILFNTETWGPPNAVPALLLMGMVSLLAIYGVVVFAVLLYKMWASIQDGHARTSPGKAVGFLFIPFFNIYWAFQALWGFARDYNAFIDRHGLDNPRLSSGLFLAYVVLSLGAIVPFLGLVLMMAGYVVGLVMISRSCDAVNALPRTTPSPRLTGIA
ncbi:MAG: hypothetical protein ACE5G0_10445 [Rhodothermales bacterium]